MEEIIKLIGALIVALAPYTATIIRGYSWLKKIQAGQKCQLRSEMLNIYYTNADDKSLKQYEYENFIYLYEAYKALGGNSFIDKIYNEIMTWEIEER